MGWIICLVLSLALLVISTVMTVSALKNKKKRPQALGAFNYLAIGVALGSVVIFLPMFYHLFKEESFAWIKTFCISVHATLQMFAVDSDFLFVVENVHPGEDWIRAIYLLYVSILYVLAPALTFGFILSMFKNITAYLKILFSRSSDIYIFSELNSKSLVLAKDLRKNHKSASIIFTDVYESNEEQSNEMREDARLIKAICMKKDITMVSFGFRKNNRNVSFFISGEDNLENINQSLKLIQEYGDRENTHLYIFSSSIESELLVSSAKNTKMKIRRVDEIRSLIEHQLYVDGIKLFETAIEREDSENKLISAVVVGIGKYGAEMIKSLVWFCQMDGYELQLDVFDKDRSAADKLTALFPEVMSEKYNGVHIAGEPYYKINVHSGVDVNTSTFANAISKINATYVFVALGTDEDNLKTAINLRMLFERNGSKPAIQAVVHNSKLKKLLSGATDYRGKTIDDKKLANGVTNYRGQAYNIDYIGDDETMYCEDVVINSKLEADALSRHLKWGAEEEFWAYEYNYRSSVASAIHMKARILCGVKGASKKEEELTMEDIDVIESLEHRRWNAYMRSQGYIYSGSRDKSSRNDLAKMHHDLVDFDSLTLDDKLKDRKVGSK